MRERRLLRARLREGAVLCEICREPLLGRARRRGVCGYCIGLIRRHGPWTAEEDALARE